MFTDNLVESRINRLEARRVAVLPLVAGAHAALAAALVLASVWSLRYIDEPPITYIPSIQVKLVPPPGRSDQPKPPAGAERPRPDPSANITPLVIPPSEPVIYSANVEGQDPNGTGVEGSDGDLFGNPGEGGDSNGVPYGMSVPHPPEPDRGPLEIGGDVCAPVRRTSLVPVYPETARKAGKQGTVVLRLVIGRDGGVTGVQVVSGLPFGLTQAAVEAARDLRFKPAFRCSTGQPVECYFDLSVEFRIN